MYRVLNKFNGKQYGIDCCSQEEASCLQNEHEDAIICDLSISKEELAEKTRKAWERLKSVNVNDERIKEYRNEWLKLDQEYIALYDEEYD